MPPEGFDGLVQHCPACHLYRWRDRAKWSRWSYGPRADIPGGRAQVIQKKPVTGGAS